MLRDLTLGRYYPVQSPVHSLDPRTKSAAALVFIVSLFLVRSSLTYLACFAVLLALYHVSCVPFGYLLRGMRGIALLLLFTLIFRAFFSQGQPLWHWGVLTLTRNGIHSAVRLICRISLMILCASLLSYTTTPRQLAGGMEQSLSGLRRFGFPVDDIALTVTIAFRFIPVLNEEIGVLIDAQAARGADFQHPGPLGTLRRVPSLVIPLFVSVLRRSAELATAMEARGYSGENRCVRMDPPRYRRADRTAWLLTAAYAAAVALLDFGLSRL